MAIKVSLENKSKKITLPADTRTLKQVNPPEENF